MISRHLRLKLRLSSSQDLVCIYNTYSVNLGQGIPIAEGIFIAKLYLALRQCSKLALFTFMWWSGNILSFLLPLFQEGQLSVTGESMCTKYWLTA